MVSNSIDIEGILSQLTLEEKVSLTAGKDFWHTVAIPRVGIPTLKVSDGPNGARGGKFFDGTPAACFPNGVCLAASFNTDLVEQVGKALGQDIKSKNAHVLLGPTLNIHRSVLGGRSFEAYSEDPLLSGKMTAAYVRGLQSEKVAATPKHYVCNEQEFERLSISSEVTDRALREIYLSPFEIAIRESDPWALMTSYNRVNGTYASEHPNTLKKILREEWGFDGLVMSDWTGVYSTADAINNTLDLEMPGPSRWRADKLLKAVKDGQVSEETITESVRRLLQLFVKVGRFEDPTDPLTTPEQGINKPEHAALIRRAAGEGIVLLKNENDALPISTDSVKSIAVFGPSAVKPIAMGGGSAHVRAHYVITPLEGIQKAAGPKVKVTYMQGATTNKNVPLFEQTVETPTGKIGTQIEYFKLNSFHEAPFKVDVFPSARWINIEKPEGIESNIMSVRATAVYTAPVSGIYIIGVCIQGQGRLLLNGKELITGNITFKPGEMLGEHKYELRREVSLEANKKYTVAVELSVQKEEEWAGFQFGIQEPLDHDAIAKAAALAAESDIAIVFTGLTDEWESEGFDRENMDFSGNQVELVEAVAKFNKRTIVVNNTGSPVTLPFLPRIQALLQAWYPGQECGNSIADILFGKTNPSGKLPTTFPHRLEDTPAFLNFPGENGKVLYGEGIFVGMRYYEKLNLDVAFPFGFGLSYTTFELGNVSISSTKVSSEKDLPITVSVHVKNTGAMDGAEAVQVYVRDVVSSLVRPIKELKAFAKIQVQAGQTQKVEISLDKHAFGYWDDKKYTWIAEAGDFEVLVGTSSQHIHGKAAVTLTNNIEWLF
ncbi:hypothetical protein BZG36_00279 [Bifiguratus adelaidae]|uniref:beta-glucosidase n=1 Tax=Bifiguratus adelaidae TaxID=1938954 RepID=A0A261Y7Q8_9FUNG|nr:hypothetical protein BZG36_00279 [Bifiguratus adelaidae]